MKCRAVMILPSANCSPIVPPGLPGLKRLARSRSPARSVSIVPSSRNAFSGEYTGMRTEHSRGKPGSATWGGRLTFLLLVWSRSPRSWQSKLPSCRWPIHHNPRRRIHCLSPLHLLLSLRRELWDRSCSPRYNRLACRFASFHVLGCSLFSTQPVLPN